MRRHLVLSLFALLVAAAPARASDVDLPAGALGELVEGLRLTPPSLIEDLVEGESRPLAQGNDKKKKGQRQGSRVRVGAMNVGGYGVSPMGKPFGIGLELGAPVSLTLKYMLTPDQGVVGGLGAFGGPFFAPNLSLYGDYLWHPHVLVRAPPFKLSWYIGGGAWLLFGNPGQRAAVPGIIVYYGVTYFWLGARLPLGINLALNQLPLEFYLQAIPSLFVFPEVTLGIGASLGVRFYF